MTERLTRKRNWVGKLRGSNDRAVQCVRCEQWISSLGSASARHEESCLRKAKETAATGPIHKVREP